MKSIRWTALGASFIVALALSVTAVGSASAAQWYVNGKKLTKYHNITTGNLAGTVKVEENLVISVPAVKLTIACKEAKVSGESRIQGISYMTVEFLTLSRCETTEPATGCELQEESFKGSGLEGAAAAEGTAPEDKLVIAPKVSEVLTTFWFNEETECKSVELAIQGLLNGQVTFAMPKGREEAVEQTVTGLGNKESPNELTFKLAKEYPAFLTGKLKVKLTSGAKWSFH